MFSRNSWQLVTQAEPKFILRPAISTDKLWSELEMIHIYRVFTGKNLQVVSSGLEEARRKIHVSSCKELKNRLIYIAGEDEILFKFPNPSILAGTCIYSRLCKARKQNDQGISLAICGSPLHISKASGKDFSLLSTSLFINRKAAY